MSELLKALLMGLVEGITEWLPISSTGHMILLEALVRFDQPEAFMSLFRVVIQLGAILAVVVLFWNKLWPFARKRGGSVGIKMNTLRLWVKILIASLPAAVIGLPLDDWMDEHFYNYITVAVMLILYGLLFIVVENRRIRPAVTQLSQLTISDVFIIGLWQCLALIPGTSRSGATVVGGLLLGLSRPCVAEFTFYLAIPVMAGASLLKVLKYLLGGYGFTAMQLGILGIGCAVAFAVSLLAIRFLMSYVKKHDFKFFGIYRIALGIVALGAAAVSAFL